MKTIARLITVAAALSLVEATSFGGEESTTATADLPSAEFRDAQVAVQKAQADAQRIQAEVMQQAEQLRARVGDMRAQLAQQGVPEVPDVPGYGAGGSVPPPPGYRESLRRVVTRVGTPTGAAKPLVIRTTDADPAAQAAIEEDLAVMMHIFNKAIEENVGGAPREHTAMGITVAFAPNVAPNRCLYLDGYGALFMLRVNFPLLGPPKEPREQPKETKPADSSWEEARRELYGQPGETKVTAETEEFDPAKVTKLKDALLEALKSATNIRNLKSDDSITLCVFGDGGQRVITTKSATGFRGGGFGGSGGTGGGSGTTFAAPILSIAGGSGRGSILTIRVRKSDVEAFAKGKLDLDQFRNKASMAVYAGPASKEAWTMF